MKAAELFIDETLVRLSVIAEAGLPQVGTRRSLRARWVKLQRGPLWKRRLFLTTPVCSTCSAPYPRRAKYRGPGGAKAGRALGFDQ